jgi:phage terminase large subunit-like protein
MINDPIEYLSQFDARLLAVPEGRRILTSMDPKLFAIIYLSKHVKDSSGRMSFSEVHDDWFEQMLGWVPKPTKPRAWRKAFVAPRSMGKSTMWFLVAPLWAGAHGHSKFVAAFADSAGQAEQHLATFKAELATNELLRKDYPEFCTAARRPGGQTESDNRSMMKMSNGFVFAAKGVDSASLGLKSGADRPDTLIFDDIEPSASNYSQFQAEKRLSTITDALLPLNEMARVAVVGTVTMPQSIIHQLVKTVTAKEDEHEQWIADEKFKTFYYKPIVETKGVRRSVWPEKWPLYFLEGIEHTRAYALNYLNDPMGNDGGYWTSDDFRYEEPEMLTWTMISIDPAVTSKTSSDGTGLAVVGFDAASGKTYVLHAEAIKATGTGIRDRVMQLLVLYPDVKLLWCEVNQGGDLWADVFKGVPVNFKTVHQTVKKEVRAASALHEYQRGKVFHVKPLVTAEQQMVGFPRAANDDIVDAIGAGVCYFAEVEKTRNSGAKVSVASGKYS